MLNIVIEFCINKKRPMEHNRDTEIDPRNNIFNQFLTKLQKLIMDKE